MNILYVNSIVQLKSFLSLIPVDVLVCVAWCPAGLNLMWSWTSYFL